MGEGYDEQSLRLDEFGWDEHLCTGMTMSQAGRLNRQMVACVKVYKMYLYEFYGDWYTRRGLVF